MKRVATKILCGTIGLLAVVLLTVSCGGGAAAGKNQVTIRIYQNQPEYTDAFNAYVEAYKRVKPNIKIDMEILQADYPSVLKAKIASGNMPDVFASAPGPELQQYDQYSEDLSNQPLAKVMTDSAKAILTYNNKLEGLVYKIDEFGIIYNKKMFEEAGITELPMTRPQLEDAAKKLLAKGHTPFSAGYKEWWVFKHVFQQFQAADAGLDAGKVVNDFVEGKTTFADHPKLAEFFDFIDFTLKYGAPKPLETDFNAQCAAIATGKVAMLIGQGTWAEDTIKKITPDIEIGFTPYAITDSKDDTVLTAGGGCVIHINNKSSVKKETLDFFNWLFTSDYAKEWFPKVAKVISPINGMPGPEGQQLPQSFADLAKTIPPKGEPINYSPDSFHMKFGEIMQGYIGKKLSKAQAIAQIQQAWQQLGGSK